jgi:hypothetical protein
MTAPLIVAKPGVYELPEAVYHADPVPEGSLSCSGAKLLLPPSCPAIFAWARKHPRAPTRAMELGTAAHREVLGTGWPVAVWPGPDWTRLVDGVNPQEWRRARRAEGLVPILASDQEKITAMAAAIRLHPAARVLLQAEEVMAERSFFWRDAEWGFWRRARFDALRLRDRVVIADYKTAVSADPEEFAKACARFGYHWQDPYYRTAVTHTLGDADPLFLFVVQEKEAPYLTGIYELDGESWARGDARVKAALRVYARCVETGVWDGYQHPEEFTTKISVPRWGM